MRLTLHVWRQKHPRERGGFVRYEAENINGEMSFLEMLDLVNEDLTARGEEPIAFDSDCREGICGTCGFMINGIAHGPLRRSVCQIYMRSFADGEELWLEPWRARAFPLIKDLVVDRSAFDRIIAAGGYVSVSTGGAPEANSIPVPKQDADLALDAAGCIACGACAAACPNASAVLFLGAKISHLGSLPQGQAERDQRVLSMVSAFHQEGFGHCTTIGECAAVCPAGIPLSVIAGTNKDFIRANLKKRRRATVG